ncbi:transcriptional regulator [Pseudokineococcus sp. 5B2Z-1]|uniref:helix-turn-helix domain-containing protein n=1 Tax=Pseudokineococcus sp. 5B2Z-1 TaxID=3132744 RepID=UPI0030AC5C71
MADDEQQARPKTLAEKIDRLFKTVRRSGEPEATYREVANTIVARGGAISASYIWQLRTGVKDNPTMKHLQALADYFQVSPAYFLDDEEAARIDSELELLAAMRDADVRAISLRASELSPSSLRLVHDLVERERQRERDQQSAGRSDPDEGDGS